MRDHPTAFDNEAASIRTGAGKTAIRSRGVSKSLPAKRRGEVWASRLWPLQPTHLPQGLQVQFLLLESQRQPRLQRVDRHDEDDAHDVLLQRAHVVDTVHVDVVEAD